MSKFNNQPARNLFESFFKKNCTHQDLEDLYNWINKKSNENELNEIIGEYVKNPNVVDLSHLPDEEEIIWKQISNKLNLMDLRGLDNNIIDKKKPSVDKYRILKIAGMISVLVMSSLISWKLTTSDEQHQFVTSAMENTVIKETRAGEKLTVRLPDGSVVKLNSSSSLEYGTDFNKTERRLSLKGEAFFDVANDKIRHFKVSTGNITTTALGTSFNISADPVDQNVKISLTSGKVKVDQVRDDNSIRNTFYLNPGEQIKYSSNIEPEKSLFDPKEVLAWKEGIISFCTANQQEVISTLENWYGVVIRVENGTSRDWDITAKFDNQTLENVLKSMSYTLNFEFYILDKEILINFKKI